MKTIPLTWMPWAIRDECLHCKLATAFHFFTQVVGHNTLGMYLLLKISILQISQAQFISGLVTNHK